MFSHIVNIKLFILPSLYTASWHTYGNRQGPSLVQLEPEFADTFSSNNNNMRFSFFSLLEGSSWFWARFLFGSVKHSPDLIMEIHLALTAFLLKIIGGMICYEYNTPILISVFNLCANHFLLPYSEWNWFVFIYSQ